MIAAPIVATMLLVSLWHGATLPFLLALEAATAEERRRLLAAFGNPGLSDSDVLAVCDILAAYNAFDRTREAASAHVEQADAALDVLPPSLARDCFSALTDYVVQRDR